MANNQKKLKAFVRYDGSGRVVASSLILRKNKPRVGRWFEIPTYECCNGGGSTTTTTTQAGNVTPTAFIKGYWLSANDSCTTTLAGSLLFYSASTEVQAGITVFSDPSLTTPIQSGYVIYSGLPMAEIKYLVGAGGVLSVFECPSQESAATAFTPGDACISTTYGPLYYTGTLGNGTALFYDATLTQPYNPGLSGTYVKLYFQAQYQVCTMSGNIIQSYVAC